MTASDLSSLARTEHRLTPLALLGMQMLVVAFGALVSVPLLTSLDPNAALSAVALGFIGKRGAMLQTIPSPVMGGLLIVLFGTITVVGLNLLTSSDDDLLEPRNLSIVAIVLVSGVGGLGIGLAAVLGLVVNLVLPASKTSG